MSQGLRTVLVTGAAGEIGHVLVDELVALGNYRVVALDLKPPETSKASVEWVTANILDETTLDNLFDRHDFDIIFHLAAILSTSGERDPMLAHKVNVEGSLNVLERAHLQGLKRGTGTIVVFPSTVAIYGIPDLETKTKAGRVREDKFLSPITMYGINKLYVEKLGLYYSTHYGALMEENKHNVALDFRCIRFPGIMSSDSVPSGGTSDYGPEMIHAAAQGRAYSCFVNPESRLPFMAMPDAVNCLLRLMQAPANSIKHTVYNVSAFSVSAAEIRETVLQAFPKASIDYKINPIRLEIVESWPADMDDSAARADWNWSPMYDVKRAFSEYLIPRIAARYGAKIESSKEESLCANGR